MDTNTDTDTKSETQAPDRRRKPPHPRGTLPHSYSLFSPNIVTTPKTCRDFVRSVLE